MALYQLGKKLSPKEVTQIVTFLNALTGEIPSDSVKSPTLPSSTAETPKPDAT